MRDIFVTLVVFASLPYIFKRPYWGAVMWVWISVMNPHSQGWGFARSFPFAAIIAGVTVLAMLTNKEKFRMPVTPVTGVFIAFALFMGVTSFFAIYPEVVGTQLIKVYKIFAMTLVVLMLMKTRKHLEMVLWAVVVSIGYYGVKGGIFTLRTAGNHTVWGPAGTFIAGNNEVALAFVMVIPLMYYLYLSSSNKWLRYAFLASMVLCAFSALGSYSRGAALAIAAMTGFLWLKSRHKVRLGVLMAVVVPLMLMFMPGKWFERIDTINTYEEDASAMGRINAWKMAFNLANDRPLGGGFEIYNSQVFLVYAPIPEDVHAAHSLYFQVLGEHGWFGLALYLALGILTWRTGSWVVRHARPHADLKWAADLAAMCQVSLIGFAVGGAFLSLAYFDVPYYIMTIMMVAKILVARELADKALLPPPKNPDAIDAEPVVPDAEPAAAPLTKPALHDAH